MITTSIEKIISDTLLHNNFIISYNGELTQDNYTIKWEDGSEILLNRETIWNEYQKTIKIEELNTQRNQELEWFIIDDLYMNQEELIKMDFVLRHTPDTEKVVWINIHNNLVEITKVSFQTTILKWLQKVQEIIFKYRELKNNI